MSDASANVTQLISELGQRDDAWNELLGLVYDELRGLAGARMRNETPDHTLQATALVHEAWVRLLGNRAQSFRDRRHFFGAAAEAMRRVLVDHARKAKADKRGGKEALVRMTLAGIAEDRDPDRLLALDEAFETLAREDERAAEVARLRLFCGLEVKDVAEALDVSERTTAREWAYARARLSELLGDEPVV